MPNLRYTARGRPHNWQRRTSRVEYFGFSRALAIFDLLAIDDPVAPVPWRDGNWVLVIVPVAPRYAAPAFPSAALNGIPKPRSICRASSSLSVEVTIVIFMPCCRVNLSGLSSGNTSCSDRPKL